MDLMRKGPTGQKSTVPEFGPQAELCRRTTCCCCHAAEVIRSAGNAWDPSVMRGYDWSLLPTLTAGAIGEHVTHPHHEPPRGLSKKSNDHDTVPLCARHHTQGWSVSRHTDAHNREPRRFWAYFGVDWRAVRDEMRQRVRAG